MMISPVVVVVVVVVVVFIFSFFKKFWFFRLLVKSEKGKNDKKSVALHILRYPNIDKRVQW